MSFLMTQNLNTFKNRFSKINELRKVNSRTGDSKKRKFIVNNAASKLFNEKMGKLDDEYNELSKKLKKTKN